MKKSTKILSLALVVLMAIALLVPVFAASNYSITINGAKDGETYTAYKMFDLTVDETGSAIKYAYKVNSAWETFFKTGAGKDYIVTDDEGYVSLVDDEDDVPAADGGATVTALAVAAKAYAEGNNITAAKSVKANDGAVLDNLVQGYYLITSTTGTVAMIKTTPSNPAAEINEKNVDPTTEKAVADEDVYAQIGDIIDYSVTITAEKGAKNYVLTDTMTSGLKFIYNNTDDFDVTVGDTNIDPSNYTVTKTTDGFKLAFKQAYLDTITEETTLVVTYKAEITKLAIDDDATQTNSAKLSWGDNSETEETEVTTTTTPVSLLKYTAGDDEKNPLAGATFQLKRGSEVVNLVKIDSTTYRVADSSDSSSQVNFETVSTGAIVIKGLDTDSTYTFVETQAPSGYKKLHDPVEVTFAASGETVVEVANEFGSELPSTGGAGTIILIAVGAVVFLGTAIVLVAKKRLYNEG